MALPSSLYSPESPSLLRVTVTVERMVCPIRWFINPDAGTLDSDLELCIRVTGDPFRARIGVDPTWGTLAVPGPP
eukprot:802683-Rhodomonas_salina.2